jgi:hypothetical protein
MSMETTSAGIPEGTQPAPPASSTSSPPIIPSDLQEKVKPLQRELLTYFRELPRLLQAGEAGRHALIRGDAILGVWNTWRDAIQAGRERFGMEPICVKQIDPQDVERLAQLIAREEARCRSSKA